MITVGIAGAGLLGRLIAWQLGRCGYEVDVFDAALGPEPAHDGNGAAAFSSAGMLGPSAELDRVEPAVAALGWRSIALWEDIAAALPADDALTGVFARGCVTRRGSLLLAHRGDQGAARRLLSRPHAASDYPAAKLLDAKMLAALEPALQWAGAAWQLDGEAQIHPAVTMRLLFSSAESSVRWHWNAPIAAVSSGCLVEALARHRRFDLAIDARGLGAGTETGSNGVPNLRGVRGETALLRAVEHGLTRPVRLLHPRHSVYLVPHGVDRLMVGATEIEAEDRSEVSVRSALELLGAAYSVMPVLAEARIERLDRNLRPALPDNAPCTVVEAGLIRINGLFRHGWLLAPALVEDAFVRAGLPALSRKGQSSIATPVEEIHV